MSIRQPETIKCEECGSVCQFELWTSLNAQLDPKAEEELLRGTLFSVTCEKCSHVHKVIYPMVYHNMDRKVMIHLCPPGSKPFDGPDAMPQGLPASVVEGYQFRQVESQNQLVEKILVQQAGLDDRILEVFKAYMEHTDKKGVFPKDTEVYYGGIEEGKKGPEIALVAVKDTGNATLRFPLQKYINVHENILSVASSAFAEDFGPRTWARVDRAWARHVLHYDGT